MKLLKMWLTCVGILLAMFAGLLVTALLPYVGVPRFLSGLLGGVVIFLLLRTLI